MYLTLFEGLDFETIKLKASTIQTHISTYTSKQKIKPVTGLYAFDVNDLELNNILEIIADISNENISPQNIATQKLYRIINLDNELDDIRAIDMLLQATFTNKVPIKLLNIYKGLCINTSSTIMKKTDQEIYVTYEQLQGTVMQFEKETVMQSSNFTKDIVADVTYIDSKKKLAILKNFRFVHGSANARKYSRVTCSQRTPISIIHNKNTLNGEILDISMNSVAIKTRLSPNIESLKLTDVSLNFTLPVSSSENGYMKLTLTATVIFAVCDESFCKVVVNLKEDQANESILMEYVYNRQKKIIVELKKQTAMLNKI
ncbi:PilZ domain-containing protein [Sulfurimonas sp.]|uniref:PilZ domain-containing protein n=1 Tax=Sulfurimonas sp. TaxID=2022749 RepID=UPI003567BE6A